MASSFASVFAGLLGYSRVPYAAAKAGHFFSWFAAVHPTMKEIMAGFIRRRHAQKQTFLVVSHDMPVIIELCPRTICMNAGKVIADEDTRAVLTDPAVIEAYLGGAAP